MKKNRFYSVVISLLILSFILVGCGEGSEGRNNGLSNIEENSKVNEGIRDDVAISIATGNTGGTYYPVGVGLGQLLSNEIPYITSSAMSTGGSVDNTTLLRNNEAQLAIMMSTVVDWAYNGTGEFEGNQHDGLRAITALWPNLNHIVVSKEIQSISDIEGKRFVVGAPRSGTETDSYAILKSQGLYFRDNEPEEVNVEPIHVSYEEAADMMRNRQVAGGMFNAFPPGSAIADLMATGDFHILSFTDEEIESILEENALFTEYTIEAGTYTNQDEDIRVVGYPNILMTTKDLDEDVVYDITKVIFESLEELESIHVATEWIKLDTAQQGVHVPFHEGAKEYYEEQGVWED